jgi:predicted RNA-binding protein YlxR (DUF448 family)
MAVTVQTKYSKQKDGRNCWLSQLICCCGNSNKQQTIPKNNRV